MTTTNHLEKYRKFLLNRVTSSPHIIEYIENCVATDNEAANHSFHKIIIHNWNGSGVELFETLADYYKITYVPVNFFSSGDITSFYTSSLTLILKMGKLDYMFPHKRNMYTVDILFNDKTSTDCFDNSVTIADIVGGVVTSRVSEQFNLDLSNFCSDREFLHKKVHFYKLSLLANFKILMLRVGRDCKSLDLSNNCLSQVPVEILNFFIRGDLTSINLSNNKIPSLQELHRVTSKIEKLWIEGNPLCQNLDPVTYIKQVTMKFPRLRLLDGIPLNEHGCMIPFYKNFLQRQDKATKMLVEKFLSLYYAHYDSKPRRAVECFYYDRAVLTFTTSFTAVEMKTMPHYARCFKWVDPKSLTVVVRKIAKYQGRHEIGAFLSHLPESVHDPTTFTVDVLNHSSQGMVLVVDGIYKELGSTDKFLRFRRTWVFRAVPRSKTSAEYTITNEMFNVSCAAKELYENNFKNGKQTNPLALSNPDRDDIATLCTILCQVTRLKPYEAEFRLKKNNWDLKKSLRELEAELRMNRVRMSAFAHVDSDDGDDLSVTSSLMSAD